MARVPGAANVQRGPSLRDPGVNAPPGAFDLGGEGLLALGQGLAERAARLKAAEEELKKKRQAAADNEFLTRYETDYAVRLAEARQELEQQALNGEVDDLPGQIRARAEEIDTTLRSELASTGLDPSDPALQAAARYSARTATRAMVQSVTFEHNARVERAVSGIQERLDALSAMTASDPGNYAAYQEEARILMGRLDDLVPQVERDKAIAGAQSNIALTAAQALARSDPRSTLQRLDAGEFNAFIDGAQKLTVMNMARTELDRRQRKAEAALALALRRAEAEVDDYASLAALGYQPRLPDLSGLPPAHRASFTRRLEAANAVGDIARSMRGATPAGRDTIVAAMAQAVERNPTSRNLDIYEGLTKVADSITRAEEDDAFSLDVRWGHVDAWQGEGAPTIQNEDYWSYVVENVNDVSLRHPNGMPIPKEAYAEIEAAFESEDLPSQNIVVRRLARLPDYARAQISARLEESIGPEVSAAAMLSGMPGKTAVVNDVLAGRQMSGPDTLTPTSDVVRKAVNEAYGGAFSGALSETGEALVAAGVALYQKRSGVTREEKVNSDALVQAFKDVVPGSVIERGGAQTFVVGEVAAEDRIDRALNAISRTERPVQTFGAAFDGANTVPVEEVLHANGDPVTWDDILDAKLIPAAQGLFYVETEFGQIKVDVPVPGTDGVMPLPYVLDLRAVMDFKAPEVPPPANVVDQLRDRIRDTLPDGAVRER